VVDTRFDWVKFVTNFSLSEEVVGYDKQLQLTQGPTKGTAALELVSQALASLRITRISVVLQSDGKNNRAIIRTTAGILPVEYLVNKQKTLSESISAKPEFSKAEAENLADKSIRKDFDLPFRASTKYDSYLSLSDFHEKELYSSYLAFDNTGALRFFPIFSAQDDLYLFETGKKDGNVFYLNDLLMGAVPFPTELSKLLTSELSKNNILIMKH